MHQPKTPLKLATFVVASLSIILLQGCSREIDARQAHVERGLIYKKDASDPFNGTLTNVGVTDVGKRYAAQYGAWAGSCKVPVSDGQFDGTAVCQDANGKKIGEFTYSKGQIDGPLKMWASDTGNLMMAATIHGGVPNGVEERYNPKTGKIISRINYSAGQKVGEEKLWDITGDTLLTDLVWENGRKTGVSRSGAYEEHYVAGTYDGTWKTCELSPAVTGEKRRAYFAKAQLYPAMAQQLGGTYFNAAMVDDPADVICKEKVYKNGVEQVAASATSGPSSENSCFDAKVAAFRKENGEDAPIMNDVMQEWEAGCKK
ncbi:hypothetical protein GTP58_27550 [Duganella sp. CY15W]|uniref:toxin-antitoxin system YwqK family antitoxin n=1 Tax=Duganella sp. CY15W TaxID=2692172 RepID=UPI00136BE607|nr:hypothetical protein [Duganella sp. CY15W]MYM32093.1 hypothetical protein [Duganella sp. CY15W]